MTRRANTWVLRCVNCGLYASGNGPIPEHQRPWLCGTCIMTEDPRAWTPLDPHLRIDMQSNDTMHLVTITHLPTGLQESCGESGIQIQNRAIALSRLHARVTAAQEAKT